jgi:hypothetical protein
LLLATGGGILVKMMLMMAMKMAVTPSTMIMMAATP